MTCHLYNGNDETTGFLNLGGTVSIMIALYANKMYFCKKKGIHKPNMVLPETVHPAFGKACAYFNIEIIYVQCKSEKRVPWFYSDR